MDPKILFIDIETFPSLVHVWRMYEDNALDTIEPPLICCFSAKWYGGTHITKALPDYKSKPNDDSKLVKDLWKLANEADILVAHNGKRFDFGKMNARFVKHGLQPPAPYQKVDTREMAKRAFSFEANSLDYLCQYLGLGKKMYTGGYELWQRCMANDPEAWKLMKKYNENDVVMLERLYFALMPWVSNHPNISLYRGKCPRCGSEKIQSRGTARTATRSYHRYQCTDCGGWSRDTAKFAKTTFTNI